MLCPERPNIICTVKICIVVPDEISILLKYKYLLAKGTVRLSDFVCLFYTIVSAMMLRFLYVFVGNYKVKCCGKNRSTVYTNIMCSYMRFRFPGFPGPPNLPQVAL